LLTLPALPKGWQGSKTTWPALRLAAFKTAALPKGWQVCAKKTSI
jgi:hypothetical protein